MANEIKTLKIKDVLIEEELYPRMQPDFVTIARYINALKSGAKFPAITVALLKGKYYLVDGRHRMESSKAVKRDEIEAEILKGLTKKEIFLESVLRNISHGRQFSTQEVVKVIITLQDWDLSTKEISEIIRIPANQIQPFVAKRITRITGTGERIPLKASLRHFKDIDVDLDFMKNQHGLSPARTQEKLVDNLILLLKKGLINRGNKKVAKKLQKLYKLLGAFI